MLREIGAHSFANRGLSTFGRNMELPRHRWFEFKEGFSQELVEEACSSLISSKRRKLRILDPFSGSGTTLVSAGQLGHQCIGVELNPFLAFAANAKIAPGNWRKKSFDAEIGRILLNSKNETRSHLEGLSTFTEGYDQKRWLFNLSVIRGFSALDRALTSSTYRNPLRLGLFSALMDSCNAKRDGKCLRYKQDWKALGYSSKELRARFEEKAKEIFEDMQVAPMESDLQLIRGDTRKRLGEIRTASSDLVVTSPPYLNSFDYSDVYRPELFAGKFVNSNNHLRSIRLQTIRSHVQAAWTPSTVLATPQLSPLLENLADANLWSARIPDMVRAYFADMQTIFEQTFRIVKSGGQAWVVVATSAYSGIHIPTDLLLADIAGRAGWNLDAVYVLRKTRAAGQQWHSIKSRSTQPLRESLIILKRP